MSRPSVLFIIADDWSPIARCYGNEVIKTPHVDALAERGVVFDYAFCTSPSCAVSRACILTGQHSHTHGQYGHCHGIHGFRTHEQMQSTPKILKAQGYATACVGKKHVEPPSVYPFDYEPEVDPRSPADIAAKVAAFLAEHRTIRSICTSARAILTARRSASATTWSTRESSRSPTTRRR